MLLPVTSGPQPTKEQFFTALTEIENFSPAPVMLANAQKILRDPQASVDRIAALVGGDAALAADIIRCANSAYYGGGRCHSIAEAVLKIGLRETIRLLNCAVARIVSGRDLDHYGIDGADFWAESLFNGLFLQSLAQFTGQADPEVAYPVGLLRFIGRLAINQSIKNLRGGQYWVGAEPVAEWELATVGLVQADAAAMLLKKWRFSETIVAAIAGQDAPARLAPGNWLAEALHFSTALLPQGVGRPFQPTASLTWTSDPFSAEFMRRYGLTFGSVEALLGRTGESFEQISQWFGT
ncbi:MAG: HDOD domain-containing protein [Opitutae bacterium]|nr:HDOD domain-containing protein [Opitutae bacterium]